MLRKPAFTMRQNNRPRYNVRQNVKIKNRLNSEVILGDLINEEEIDGKSYFVIRNNKGHVIKLTKEAYSLVK